MTSVVAVKKPRRRLGGDASLEDLVAFLCGQTPLSIFSGWGEAEGIKMYLRQGPVAIGTKAVRALQIANVSVVPKRRRKGLFKSWLIDIEKAVAESSTVDVVYVENLFNKHLAAFLKVRGYATCNGLDGLVYSYMKDMQNAVDPTPTS